MGGWDVCRVLECIEVVRGLLLTSSPSGQDGHKMRNKPRDADIQSILKTSEPHLFDDYV